jgi:hypothetical protein
METRPGAGGLPTPHDPDIATLVGTEFASLTMMTLPGKTPDAGGVKLMGIPMLVYGPSVIGNAGVACSPKGAPETRTLVIVIVAVPVLARTRILPAAVPAGTCPNNTGFGEADR